MSSPAAGNPRTNDVPPISSSRAGARLGECRLCGLPSRRALDRADRRLRGLGIAAQGFLVVVIIGYVMPWFGADLLEMAHGVADFNLPAQVGMLFGVSL